MPARAEILDRLPLVFGLPEPEAAAAIGVSVTKFRELVDSKIMPKPRRLGARKIYDVDEVRAAFKALPHDGETDKPPEDSWADFE